jgi:hypothetical protein
MRHAQLSPWGPGYRRRLFLSEIAVIGGHAVASSPEIFLEIVAINDVGLLFQTPN